ncbi:MAG: hypothetical protein Q8807_03225, partial ['Waltheria sp.' little leaf phytoplasma]|nr:hypothetical protein ['Waltheria sp.' little leaf phytoplasma]
VAGLAMGLFFSSENDYVILSDIQGLEDQKGDMDFKIAGTVQGQHQLIFSWDCCLQGNDIIYISCCINVSGTCHLILRYSLLLKQLNFFFSLGLKLESSFNCVHLLNYILLLLEVRSLSFFPHLDLVNIVLNDKVSLYNV